MPAFFLHFASASRHGVSPSILWTSLTVCERAFFATKWSNHRETVALNRGLGGFDGSGGYNEAQ
jgi:hypothetical protein